MKKEEILDAIIENPDIVFYLLENRGDIMEKQMATYYSVKQMATFIYSEFENYEIKVILKTLLDYLI